MFDSSFLKPKLFDELLYLKKGNENGLTENNFVKDRLVNYANSNLFQELYIYRSEIYENVEIFEISFSFKVNGVGLTPFTFIVVYTDYEIIPKLIIK